MNHLLFYVKENQIPPTYSSLNFFIFHSLQFSNTKKFISLFSGKRHTKLKLDPHMDSRLMYHVYLNRAAGVYLFLHFFNFLSLKFQNIKFFITLFCKAYKVETWYTHGQIVDLLCTPTATSQNILVPLFFFYFLSLQLAKIKNLLLQNCFIIPLMATAGGMWALLTLCYSFHGNRGMQAAPSSIPAYGTFFRGDLVMKQFLWPFSLFCWFKKNSCQLLAKECALSIGKLPRRLVQEQCG